MAITYNGSGVGGAIVAGVDQWTPVQGNQVHNDLKAADTSIIDHETRIDALEGSSGGDVDGPAGATDNAIARFDGTSGKLIQNSGITIADAASGTLAGSNSGDVTLTGTPDYITISSQVITVDQVDLTADVTGDLPYANLTPSAAANRLLGRGSSGGAGDWQEIALGSNLTMSGTTLNAAGGTGGALDDLSDVVITTAATDQLLKYNGTNWVNSTAATASIADDAVTYAKIQNISAASKLLGRGSAAGSGNAEEITLGTNLSMSGTTLNATSSGGVRQITFIFDGGGSVITTGEKASVRVPITGTITRATMVSMDAAVTSGSIVVDLWYDSYANYPPTNADSITASAPPTISSAVKSDDATLTGWSTSVTAGGFLRANVDSVTSFTLVGLFIEITP